MGAESGEEWGGGGEWSGGQGVGAEGWVRARYRWDRGEDG